MQEKTMTTDIAAALLADVPRYRPEHPGVMVPDINGVWVDHRHVLAALTAALDPALSERAGEVLEGVTPGPWVTGTMLPFTVFNPNPKDNDDSGVICDCQEPANARFIAWCREGVPALLARIAAQQAQIKGLDQKVNGLCDLYSQASEQVQSAGAALTAERAKVAKLVEAGKDALIVLEEFHIGPESPVIAALRAAITEAGQ